MTDLFLCGPPAKGRYLVLGPMSPTLISWSSSLHIEHVSAADLVQQEIARRSALGQAAENAARQGTTLPDPVTFAVLRRWFWARRPEAGFVLQDFPATLLQAQVFDEWLDTRECTLTALFFTSASFVAHPVAEHYRNLGLELITTNVLAAA